MKDKLGRNINYLRISITDRCNLRCRYCMPETGIEKKEHSQMLTLEEIYEITEACANLGITKVRITGGEPLIKKGIVELISQISSIKTIKDIALTTNGVLLDRYAQALKDAGLKRVNISLDTLSKEKYSEITRMGSLEDVLSGIEAARKAGLLPIKLNTVLIGGFNDAEIEDFVRLTENNEIDIRFIELMPIGQASDWTSERFLPNTTVLERVKELVFEEGDDPCSPAKYYRLPGAKGRVGLINPISHTFCGSCNRIRLTADGMLKPCLHSDKEIDLKAVLKENRNLETTIAEAILGKPLQHEIGQKDYKPIERDMFRIGG